jgi:dihydrolipoamide dehydrogenase
VIPSVAYTDLEVAWVGVTENEANAAGVKCGKGVLPWAASGRSLTLGRDEGIPKVVFDESTNRIVGCGSSAETPETSSPRPQLRSRWVRTRLASA